jgi:hypothetical protein
MRQRILQHGRTFPFLGSRFSMRKASAVTLAIGWAILFLIHATGNLMWDNRLLWLVACAFGASCSLALAAAAEHSEQRGASVAIALASLASCLLLAVLWFFLFALVGK